MNGKVNMGIPFQIDSRVLTLGRYLRQQALARTTPLGRHGLQGRDRESPSPTLITLSSGQMLLPGITSPPLLQGVGPSPEA